MTPFFIVIAYIYICKYKYISKYNQQITYNVIFMYVHADHSVLGNQPVCSFLRKNTSKFIQFPIDHCVWLRPLEIFLTQFGMFIVVILIQFMFGWSFSCDFVCIPFYVPKRHNHRAYFLFLNNFPPSSHNVNSYNSNKRQNNASILPIPSCLNIF